VPYVIEVQDAVGPAVHTSGNVRGYVSFFDPDAHNGMGELRTTLDLDEALMFVDMEDAWEYWRTQSRVLPLRPDGKPNRPMTAFTVTVEAVESPRRGQKS